MLVVCFWFLLCFGCSFVIVGDTYVVCWFGGCCLFVGSSVVGSFCLAEVYNFWALGLRLGMFMLSRWFGVCCFLLFTSALQGWGPAPTLGAGYYYYYLGALRCSDPAPMSGHAVVLFVISGEVKICSV
jgi:hypothetical protein